MCNTAEILSCGRFTMLSTLSDTLCVPTFFQLSRTSTQREREFSALFSRKLSLQRRSRTSMWQLFLNTRGECCTRRYSRKCVSALLITDYCTRVPYLYLYLYRYRKYHKYALLANTFHGRKTPSQDRFQRRT